MQIGVPKNRHADKSVEQHGFNLAVRHIMGGFFRRLMLGVRPHIGVKPARVQLPVSADTNKKNTRTDYAVHQ